MGRGGLVDCQNARSRERRHSERNEVVDRRLRGSAELPVGFGVEVERNHLPVRQRDLVDRLLAVARPVAIVAEGFRDLARGGQAEQDFLVHQHHAAVGDIVVLESLADRVVDVGAAELRLDQDEAGVVGVGGQLVEIAAVTAEGRTEVVDRGCAVPRLVKPERVERRRGVNHAARDHQGRSSIGEHLLGDGILVRLLRVENHEVDLLSRNGTSRCA